MTLVVPDVGEVKLLDNAFLGVASENLTLKLYATTVSIAEGTTHTAFTEVSTTNTGYAAKTLTAGSWNAASTATGTTSKTYAEQTFSFTGAGLPVTVYGYYVVGATSGVLYWAEELYASGQAFQEGDSLKITPRIELA